VVEPLDLVDILPFFQIRGLEIVQSGRHTVRPYADLKSIRVLYDIAGTGRLHPSQMVSCSSDGGSGW
jgi:hypothetical protein